MARRIQWETSGSTKCIPFLLSVVYRSSLQSQFEKGAKIATKWEKNRPFRPTRLIFETILSCRDPDAPISQRNVCVCARCVLGSLYHILAGLTFIFYSSFIYFVICCLRYFVASDEHHIKKTHWHMVLLLNFRLFFYCSSLHRSQSTNNSFRYRHRRCRI